MLKLCCALGAIGAAAYTAPLARHRRIALRTPSLRAKEETWAGSDVDPWNPITEDRVFEVCYLDEAGEHIEECVCESEAELIEKGLVPPRRGKDNSDLLFAVPNSGADGETLFSLADYETCLADDVCEVSDEIVDKAYGPDVLEKIKAARGEEDTADIPSQKAARFHVHFGAGRLGLGLVVPAIAASGVPFAVVQRPKPRWEQLFANSEEIDVSVNGEVKMKGAQVLAAHERPPETVPATSLVFGASSEDLASLLSRATSFSCSLGAAMRRVMTSTLSALPEVVSETDVAIETRKEQLRSRKLRKRRQFDPSYESATDRVYSGDLSPEKDPRPVLYCAENDHESVARLKRELRTRVRVVDCMVDRVCTGRRIGPQGVEIDAEPWPGSIVVLEPGFDPRYVPFAPSVATLPESLRHADYLSERKFSLVNGMHTVVAFLTLDYMYNPVDPGGREYVLIKYSKMRRAEQRKVEAWRTARIARLIEQFGIESIMRWEGADNVVEVWNSLLAFGDEVLTERFSAVDDLVSRVLGGGVANRYETRLKPTVKWLENRHPDALSAFFLHAARWDREQAATTETTSLEAPIQSAAEAEAFVRDTCAELLKRGKRFCNKELEITHKQLIREQRQFGGKKFAPLVVDAIAEDKARAVAILQERRLKREEREREMRVLYESSTMAADSFGLRPDRASPKPWKGARRDASWFQGCPAAGPGTRRAPWLRRHGAPLVSAGFPSSDAGRTIPPEHTFESDIARAATLCRGDDEHLLRIWGWLDNGADVDEAGGDAWDGEELCVLSRCEHPYLAKFLVERGADVNRADRYGATPLYHACSNPNDTWGTEIMNALLDAGADVDAKTTVALQRVAIAGETALSTSLDYFRRERAHRKLGLSYVSLLLRRGASLDDCWGGMPAEECLRHIETPDAFGDDINEIYDPRGASDASDVASRATDKDFLACKKMIADERRRRYLLPRKELLRLRLLVSRHRATSRLKRSLPSTVASSDKTPRKFDRKFDCKTDAGVRDALAQTKPELGFIIPPPRQSYSQRPLSTTSVAAMRHIEWLMAKDTPKELVWRVLEYWNVRT